jgi:hypothetical protein
MRPIVKLPVASRTRRRLGAKLELADARSGIPSARRNETAAALR